MCQRHVRFFPYPLPFQSELYYTDLEKLSAQHDECRALYLSLAPAPKRPCLLGMRSRLRNPSPWPRAGVFIHALRPDQIRHRNTRES